MQFEKKKSVERLGPLDERNLRDQQPWTRESRYSKVTLPSYRLRQSSMQQIAPCWAEEASMESYPQGGWP